MIAGGPGGESNRMTDRVQSLLDAVVSWARGRASIRGVALVGSHAREDARPASDVDLVILALRPRELLKDTAWPGTFGQVVSVEQEDWGRVTSLRVTYRHGPEVEFGLTTPDWARVPVDAGTRRVAADGMIVLHDPDGVLARLCAAVSVDGRS